MSGLCGNGNVCKGCLLRQSDTYTKNPRYGKNDYCGVYECCNHCKNKKLVTFEDKFYPKRCIRNKN